MFISSFRLKTYIQKLLFDLRSILEFPFLHPNYELSKRALQESATYIQEHMPDAVGLETARQVLDLALTELPTDGVILEFGVFRGGTIRYLAKAVPGRKVHGFDSFEGLPEIWSGGANNSLKGAFTTHGKLPKVPRNVTLHKGLFNETVPRWLAGNQERIALIHIDCDLYSSTKSVFEALGGAIGPGTVIVFDEYFNYPNWQRHEFRAFQEFVKKHNLKYEYLAYARIQVAVRILA